MASSRSSTSLWYIIFVFFREFLAAPKFLAVRGPLQKFLELVSGGVIGVAHTNFVKFE